MSYDVGLYIHTGKGEVEIPGTESNYTYNVSPMLKAIDWKEGIHILNGKKAQDCVLSLQFGIRKMEDNSAEYIAMNPENGWGSYEGCLKWLRTILSHCEQHPLATLRIT
jgi:hypothetical protein